MNMQINRHFEQKIRQIRVKINYTGLQPKIWFNNLTGFYVFWCAETESEVCFSLARTDFFLIHKI